MWKNSNYIIAKRLYFYIIIVRTVNRFNSNIPFQTVGIFVINNAAAEHRCMVKVITFRRMNFY